jgi:hypothetical protein
MESHQNLDQLQSCDLKSINSMASTQSSFTSQSESRPAAAVNVIITRVQVAESENSDFVIRIAPQRVSSSETMVPASTIRFFTGRSASTKALISPGRCYDTFSPFSYLFLSTQRWTKERLEAQRSRQISPVMRVKITHKRVRKRFFECFSEPKQLPA